MAKSGIEITPNFVPILYISPLYPNFVYSQFICNPAPGQYTMENILMGMLINRRLAPILLGFVCIGFLLACETSPPYDAIPAPVTQESGDTDLAELLNSIRLEERLPGLAAAIIIDGKLHSAAAMGVCDMPHKLSDILTSSINLFLSK
jgi:hypothetical protein